MGGVLVGVVDLVSMACGIGYDGQGDEFWVWF
jgi:hypothetical protein